MQPSHGTLALRVLIFSDTTFVCLVVNSFRPLLHLLLVSPCLNDAQPDEEIVYVLEGALEYQLEGRPPATLKAGDVMFALAGPPHAEKNGGGRNGAELATYLVEKGKPLSLTVR